MLAKKSRFVLLCQQALACGAVLALVAPTTAVVTLDIVAPAPDRPVPGHTGRVAVSGSRVATKPVEPQVRAVPVRGVDPAGVAALAQPVEPGGATGLRLSSAETGTGPGDLAALTAPEPVDGLGTVGVTWKRGAETDDESLSVSVRTEVDGAWSPWEEVPFHDTHGPDPSSAEGAHARPGTDPVYVGDVDAVQMKAETLTGEVPAGMQLDVVDPGDEGTRVVEKPAIDTATLSSAETADGDPATGGLAALAGAPADVTPKPQIYSRAQWGADERLRDQSSLHYFEVHAGFVHHTVNANSYTRAQVPSIIRGIYAYHTRSRGWSDIGYNFLVDRFGRIWEGRYGGVDRPVVGAHTQGYNDYAFAASAIGNFDVKDGGRGYPPSAMLNAYGRLFAWKLSLHGVAAGSTRQWVGKRYLPAVNGHRDVGQTACPGRYLYAKVPTIRRLAAADQHSWGARARDTDVSGSRWPDIVVRDKATERVYVVHTQGQTGFGRPRVAATGWSGMDLVAPVGDLDGDRRADLLARDRTSRVTTVFAGDAAGRFSRVLVRYRRQFSALDQLMGVGDLNHDGRNDAVGVSRSEELVFFPGRGNGRFRSGRVLAERWPYDLTAGVDDLTGDGRADLVARAGQALYLFPTDRGHLGARVRLPGSWSAFTRISGFGDVTNDGLPDLVARTSSGATYLYPGDGRGGLAPRLGAFSGLRGLAFLASAGTVRGARGADLVGRDSSGRLLRFPNNHAANLGRIADTGTRFHGATQILSVGDWDGDGHGDVMTRSATGTLFLHFGDGYDHFPRTAVAGRGFRGVAMLTAVGDLTGDGYPDLMGQPSGQAMRIYPGNGSNGFRAGYVAHAALAGNLQVGVGTWDGDGSPDTMVRRSDGSLVLYPGNGPGGLTGGRTLAGSGLGAYSWLLGPGDVDGDGHADLVGRDRAGNLWLVPGTGTGLGPRRFLHAGFAGYDLGG